MVVRAAQDRALDDGGRLFDAADASAELGRTTLDLPARPGMRARQAVLAVRVLQAEVKRPKAPSNKGLPEVQRLTLVDLCELDPPAGVSAVHWRLLTTLAADDLHQALAVANLYRRRWGIEQLFRSLKTRNLKTRGFDIESLRIEDDAPRCNLAMAALIAAVTNQQLVHARDGKGADGDPSRPLRPLTDAFDPEDLPLLQALTAQPEGKTARQNPHPPQTLAYAVCARPGGWTGTYGKPGPVVMLEGWFQFQAARRGAWAMKATKAG